MFSFLYFLNNYNSEFLLMCYFQQRPGSDGTLKYSNSWHVVKETAKYEGLRGFYRGITSNLLKNLPAASLTFVVYENVIKLFKAAKEKT